MGIGAGRELDDDQRIAIAAVALTPITLVLDYRAGLSPVSRAVFYVPIGEGTGRPVVYEQLLGTTQILWLALGAAALTIQVGVRRSATAHSCRSPHSAASSSR